MVINEKLIELELCSKSKEDVIQKLCAIAQSARRIDNIEEFRIKVIKREEEISTDLGLGIAIPHGKSSSVIEPFIIFAKLQQPIQWNEKDHSMVDLVFMIGVPEVSESNTHLKLISQLAGKLIDEDFIDTLRATKNKAQALNYFTTIKL